MAEADKAKALENAIAHIEKQFGKGSIMKLGEAQQRMAVDTIPTGSIALDIALGVGGVHRGRVTEVFGPESSGKTTLLPRAVLEGGMGDSRVCLQARLMSQALRKLTGAISRSHTSLIFTNQLREKVGVMFGWFSYTSRVVLANGKTMKIGTIVNKKLPVEVLSLNHETSEFQARRVVNWFNNGRTEKFLKFTVEAVGRSGRHTLSCTPQHRLLTPRGYRSAADMSEGGELM